MNRVKKELYKQLDEVLKELASQIPIEDVCFNALSIMKDAHIDQFIKIKISLQFLISSKTTLEEKIESLTSIDAELGEKNKIIVNDIAKMREMLDTIEEKHTKEIKDLKWAVNKLIEGMTKKLEKNKSGDKQDE